MYEFALGGPDPTTQFALARNPWNLEHIPGGSSSGSGSAVASGQCMGALGSCTGGSIRGPASYCGVVGLKATYGRVSRSGVVTLSWSQDHCGPLTWTVEDSALMLQAIAGHDPKDPASSTAPTTDYSEAIREDISGLVVGLPRHFFFDPRPSVDPEVQATVETAVKELESLGARVEEVTIPSLEYVRSANSIIMLTEAYSFHADNLRNRPGDYGQQARVRFRTGGLLSASDYLQATKIRQVAKREFAQALEKVDVLVSPTMTQPAAPFQGYDPATTARDPSFTAPYNFTGLPAISVPCGFTQKGLPVGMQIAGKPFAEPDILRVAHTYERHAGWYKRRPPV
jgi:aspartyl-tRNA(Asn)/glutamyl-tRNA(Gln) amidotransferase subunit A